MIHATLTQTLGLRDSIASFNAPAWSISAELWTYALFGVVTTVFGSNRIRTVIWLGLGGGSFLFLVTRDDAGPFSYLLSCWAGFFFGAVLGQYKLLSESNLVGPAMAMLIAFMYFVPQFSRWDRLVYPLSAFLIITAPSAKSSFIKLILTSKIGVWLGRISYALYMCHFAVIWGVTQFIRVVCKAPEIRINGSSYSSLTMFQTLLALLSVIALSLGLAHLSHRLIEEPFRRWSRKILLNPEAK